VSDGPFRHSNRWFNKRLRTLLIEVMGTVPATEKWNPEEFSHHSMRRGGPQKPTARVYRITSYDDMVAGSVRFLWCIPPRKEERRATTMSTNLLRMHRRIEI
jgi:hypothetical protein